MVNGFDDLSDLKSSDLLMDLGITGRSCGDCQLCCKLLPVHECGKVANKRCEQQRVGKGCLVYNTFRMPSVCKTWSCAWLVGSHTQRLKRPDRSHFVVDTCFDLFAMRDENDPEGLKRYRCLQIWMDPKFPDAWKVPELHEYVNMYGHKGVGTFLRYGSSDASLLICNDDGSFVTKEADLSDKVGLCNISNAVSGGL